MVARILHHAISSAHSFTGFAGRQPLRSGRGPPQAWRHLLMDPHREQRTPWTDARVGAGIILTLTIPAILTVRSIYVSQSVVPLGGNPSPLGYTRSLSLFAVPVLVLAWWFL